MFKSRLIIVDSACFVWTWAACLRHLADQILRPTYVGMLPLIAPNHGQISQYA